MANLKDKIRYNIRYRNSWAHKYVLVRMHIYGEFLGTVKFYVDNEYKRVKYNNMIEGLKAPYFSLDRDNLRELAENYLKEKGYYID